MATDGRVHGYPSQPCDLLVWINVGATRDDPVERLLHVPCFSSDTLAVLRTKMADTCRQRNAHNFEDRDFDWVGWLAWTVDKRFEVSGCTLPEEATLEMLALKTGEHLRFMHAAKDCRAEGESVERSVQRLNDLRAVKADLQARKDKAALFNEYIDRVRSELTMSDEDSRNIIRLLVEQRAPRLTPVEAARLVIDNSHDYVSNAQFAAFIAAYAEPAQGYPGETGWSWGSFGDWMASFLLDPGPCAFRRPKIDMQPPRDVIGKDAYPATYHGLSWTHTYTYLEARPIIAKFLIGHMGALGHHPVGVFRGDDPYTRRPNYEIVEILGNRAQLRSAGMRGWSKLIQLAPLIGRWSLFLKPWYTEVSLKPEVGSVWFESRDRFADMQAEEPERNVRPRVE